MTPIGNKSTEKDQDPDFLLFVQTWNPPTCVPFPWTMGHVTAQSGGSRTTPSPRGARPLSTVAVGGMRTTSFSAKTALPSAPKAERVWLQDHWKKCAFDCFLNIYMCVTLFRCSLQEEDYPNKEKKHWLHTKPPNLKAVNLSSHLYLCLYFMFFSFTVFLVLLYFIIVVVWECNSDCCYCFHISQWQKTRVGFVPVKHFYLIFYFAFNCSTTFMACFIW